MQLQFRSSYQDIAEYNVIKHSNNCQIRVRYNIRSGEVYIDDWSKDLSEIQRKALFREFLSYQRLDRDNVRNKYKTISNQVEKDIYKNVFLKAIKDNKRMFRANISLH
jgi:hypothetical protein